MKSMVENLDTVILGMGLSHYNWQFAWKVLPGLFGLTFGLSFARRWYDLSERQHRL